MSEEVRSEVVAEVQAEVKPCLEERVASLEASMVALKVRVCELVGEVSCVEFSKEERDVIVRAFAEVHKDLGVAFSTLAAKDIGYVAEFDSKRGTLRVRLTKVEV